MSNFKTSIDWLEYTMPTKIGLNESMSEINYYINSDYTPSPTGLQGYEHMLIGTGNSKILFSDTRPETHYILPGEWCQHVGTELCTILLSWIRNNDGHLTRLDLAGDDYDKRVYPKDIAKLCNKGYLVSHFRYIETKERLKNNNNSLIYIGAPSSERRIRIYDKAEESNHKIDAIRWEIVLRDKFANIANEQIQNINVPQTFVNMLVSMIDFKEITKDYTVTRRPRSPWFKEFVGEAEKSPYTHTRPISTIEQIEQWLKQQVSPSMAAVTLAHYGDLSHIENLVSSGELRINKRHEIAINNHNHLVN